MRQIIGKKLLKVTIILVFKYRMKFNRMKNINFLWSKSILKIKLFLDFFGWYDSPNRKLLFISDSNFHWLILFEINISLKNSMKKIMSLNGV